ncbi:MAG: XRE family transcriptional regulator [Actinobacteria bacterium]|nr:MAG: XRE family transcriptional regulator [Actinomycetota bacterium]
MKQVTRLKTELFYRQISQRKVAKKAGVDPAFISRICNGANRPSKKVKEAICELTGLTELQLFGGEESKKAS